MTRVLSEFFAESLYYSWLYFGKFMAWRMRRAKSRELPERVIWKYRRECGEGYMGTVTKHKPQSKISRFFDLLLWYSPLGQYMVWRIKKSDW